MAKMVNSKDNPCNEPCTFLNIKVIEKYPKFFWPLNTVAINFPMRIQIAESYLIYNALSILAEIGGYVGLFLGFSIYNALDFIESMIGFLKRYMEHFSK